MRICLKEKQMSDDSVACWNPDIPLEKRKEYEEQAKRRAAYSNSWQNNEKDGYGEPKIRVPDEKTDFSNLEMHKMDWDFQINGKDYDVYLIHGYIHSYGSHGVGDKYVVPRNEKPSYENIRPFDNDWGAVEWGYEISEVKSWKHKWNEWRTESRWKGVIKRNGMPFHTVYGNDEHVAYIKTQEAILQLKEHVIPFHFIDWYGEVIDRKIWYHDQPCIITNIFTGDGETWLKVVGDNPEKKIPAPADWDDDENGICNKQRWEEDYADGCRVEWNSPHIKWFREVKGIK
jgi:hypothetical protein